MLSNVSVNVNAFQNKINYVFQKDMPFNEMKFES